MSDELENLVNMPDDKIDTLDIPEVTDWTNAKRGKFYRIKTAFFVDPVGGGGKTPEEEMASEKESLEEELGVKLDIKQIHHMGQIEEGTDLLLFDFGGMMMGNSLAEDNSRRVIRWAEDHPSALVIIISTFTYDHAFRYAIEEHLGLDATPSLEYNKPDGKRHETAIHNIVVESWRENFIPDWFRDAHGCKPYDDPWKDIKKTPEAEIEAEVNADIAKLSAPDDEEFLREVEKKHRKKKKPVTSKAEADAILELQKLDPGRNARLTAVLAAMNNRVAKLPAQTFFEPNKKFLTYMKKFRLRYVYDVGAGQGHVAKALRKAGIKKVNPIDLFPREGSVTKITFGDGTSYPFKANSLVMLCRPCHGMFPEATIENAIRRKADIMYVGLTKNVKNDLGDFFRKFKKVLSKAGADGEHVWLYQGK